jgi:hypothetical protein
MSLAMGSAEASDGDCIGGLDLVTICILAVNRLAPATLRSAVSGKALKVVVPDPQVGAVFRAALDRMGTTRSTDRLIEIVVDGKARPD